MQLTTGYENRRARIEIVPLIDVVFLLLVFFIYAMLSMTVYRGLRVDLPSGEGRPEESDNVIVTIAADNSLSIAGRAVTIAEAVSEAAGRPGDATRTVLVSGDRHADLGVGVELLSALREADIATVSFQVRHEP